ncbi:hypothetical protein SAMN05920897_1401, partial [Alkalispirochaeta americana]
GIMTVEKPKPLFSELRWELAEHDEDGRETGRQETNRITVGDPVILSAQAENFPDGSTAWVRVYEEPHEGSDPVLLYQELLEVRDQHVTCSWQVTDNPHPEAGGDPYFPTYFFRLEAVPEGRAESQDSATVEVQMELHVRGRTDDGRLLEEGTPYEVRLPDGTVVREGTLDADGTGHENEMERASYQIVFLPMRNERES